MRQKTAKTVLDVLEWIESNGHHKGEWIGPRDAETHLVLIGHGCRLRIPTDIQEKTRDLTRPGGQFDTRMYRANRTGRRLLLSHRKEHPRG